MLTADDTIPDHCWIMMTTTVMMTPADGFQNNCGTFTNNILMIDECRGDVVILKEFHVYFSLKISSWLRLSHEIFSFDSWRLSWWFTSENMDFVTQLETILMFTDAYSRLIAYTFKFNLLSVTDPHYGLNKYTECYCYLLVQLQCDDDSWWPCLWNLTFDVRVRLLNLSLRLLQAQHSLSVVLFFIYILVSIKIEVDATTTKNALSSTTTMTTFCGIFFLCFSWWYLFISSCCLLFLSCALYICFDICWL